MIIIPSNIIPLLILAVAILVMGWRGLIRYAQVKSPLILYYALTALLAGLSSLAYSLPFVISQNEQWLKLMVTVGDVLYYAAAIMMLKVIWYLRIRQRLSFGWFLWPTLILSVISLIFDVTYRFNHFFGVVDNVAVYPIAPIALRILSLLNLIFIIGGAVTIREAVSIKDSRQRLRLLSIGAVIFLGGLIAEYNFLFLQGSNASSASLLGYIVVAILFFAGLLVLKRGSKNSRR